MTNVKEIAQQIKSGEYPREEIDVTQFFHKLNDDEYAPNRQKRIQVRDVEGASGGQGQDDNPFCWEDVCKNIESNLLKDGYKRGEEYEIMLVPNIINITYGRGVGYVFEEEIFDQEISSISATKIRSELRKKGEL